MLYRLSSTLHSRTTQVWLIRRNLKNVPGCSIGGICLSSTKKFSITALASRARRVYATATLQS